MKKLDRICQIWSLCASRSADLHGILLSQSNIKSLSEKGDFEVGLPRLSGRISSYEAVPLCLSLDFRVVWSPGGKIYDYAVGQKVSKTL